MAQIMPLFSRPDFWIGLLLCTLLFLLIAWRKRLRWWTAWLLRMFLVTLILLGVLASNLEFDQRAAPPKQIMVVDQSDSLSAEARLQIWQQAVQWQAAVGTTAQNSGSQTNKDNRTIIVFGTEPLPILPQSGDNAARLQPRLDGRASDLPGALRLAENLLAGSTGKIILATDGLAPQTTAAESVFADLAKGGHTLDVIPLAPRNDPADLAVGGLAAPKTIWAGTAFDLLVPVFPPGNGSPVVLGLAINGQPVSISAERSGENSYRFRVPPLPEGLVTLQVTGGLADTAATDPFQGNNTAYATLQVFPSPRVLFITSRPEDEAVARFVDLLGQNAIQVETIAPEQLQTNLTSLQDFRVIFLDNLLSSQLTREQMTALQVFVSRFAGGLVFLGGRNSYTLGGYKDSLLEPMMPVQLEPPPRTQRTPIVFQLILDRSSSMGVSGMGSGEADAGLMPIVLAREAAMRSIETLRVEDYLGVLTFSDDPYWDVPLRPVGGPQGLQDALNAVSRVEADGSTFMYQAMEDALVAVMTLPVEAPLNRHVLVLSDGQSTDGSFDTFRELAATARSGGVTVSSIALGDDADAGLMAQIAEAGNGRFYEVRNASDLPRILISESQAARSENIQTGETSLEVREAGHPILSGFSQRDLPLLRGYNALKSKAEEGAEDVLVSASFGDPLLSTWQYGLGRVVAWTGDLGEEWTGSWPGEKEGAFWAQVVRYALVDPGLSPAQVNVNVEANRVMVDTSIYDEQGEPVNLAEVIFTYADQENKAQRFRLAQKSAGSYQAELPRPPDGAYRAVLSYTGEDGQTVEVPAPFSVNPPPEWMPGDAAAGQANLTAWAIMANGTVTTAAEALQPESNPVDRQASSAEEWLQRLLLALVLLWPLEIAIRRRWLPWI